MSGMNRLTDDSGYEAFAAYFRKNYPGPDTIIGNPDWHAPRLYRAALDAHRRASQAAPAPSDDACPCCGGTGRYGDACVRAINGDAPAPSDGLREENERITRKVAALIDPDAMKERGCDASSYTWEHHPLAQRVAISKARKVLGFLRAALSPAPAPSDGLREALEPFAEFARASSFGKLPDDMPMTQGSRFARRQVTAGDFKRALAALSVSPAQEGDD